MAICNVFKELTKSNGTFFTFSQYAEDLTKHQSNNSYKVVPSKFICCDVDYSLFNNETLPNLLQNNFENGCSFLRSNIFELTKNNVQWTPEISKTLFWNEIGSNLLFANDENSIVYYGDINIQSYSEKDNVGYNEIYCYVPNDAKKMIFDFELSNENQLLLEYGRDYICGYDSNDDGFNGLLDIKQVYQNKNTNLESILLKDYKYQYNSKYIIDLSESQNTGDTLFKFNTVIVFYDIIVGDKEEYTNIPLGMFVTGLISDGKMDNEVTKYVSNEDIYGAGTSYGLRICNRFVVSPNGTEIRYDTDISSGEDEMFPALAQVMSAMTDSQSKMDEVISNLHEYQDGIKEHLAQFKNSRVNIPYILYVNDIPYWFINGKNTGVKVWGDLKDNLESLQISYDKLNDKVDGVIEFEKIGEFKYIVNEYIKSVVIKPYLLPGTYSIMEVGDNTLLGGLQGENPAGMSLILRDCNISDDNSVNNVVINVIPVEKYVTFTSTRPFTLEICPVKFEFLKTYYNSENKESLKINLQAGSKGFTINYPNITIKKMTEEFKVRDL